MVADGAPSPDSELFWEMGKQTAVRRGDWKLTLNGQLVEGAPPEDDVFLANVVADMGEKENLAQTKPELVAELRAAAEQWRAGIEARWAREWEPKLAGEDGAVAAQAVAERGLA